MSSSLDFRLKKKKESVKNYPYLLYLSTTPARELTAEVPFVFCAKSEDEEYDGWTVVSNELLQDVLNYYTYEIQDYKKSLTENLEDKTKLETNLVKVTSVEIYNKMQEDIEDITSTIKWLKEEIESKEYYLNRFQYLKEILEDNKENFELVYYFC